MFQVQVQVSEYNNKYFAIVMPGSTLRIVSLQFSLAVMIYWVIGLLDYCPPFQ